jgi:hypothetical protein
MHLTQTGRVLRSKNTFYKNWPLSLHSIESIVVYSYNWKKSEVDYTVLLGVGSQPPPPPTNQLKQA